jgi:hypothetical protein
LHSGKGKHGSISFTDNRRFDYPSRAKREITVLKKPDNYSEKFYTDFSERKMPNIRFSLSPAVNWLEKSSSQVNQL